ncbi:auxin-responsive protein SAUR36-like [Salvia miltiorrhiza]|uniref:auxin-responsive protein SAUR36-like n=1 Tax=Salvia miltiorrhiza TaxID=226208 RepID=UPI0025ABBB6A|nr:auxin-responsive protein SAUR36-like [Salvia miltiorrhiza]
MARSKGIRLGRKLGRLFKWRKRPASISKLLCKWAQPFRRLCPGKRDSDYIRLGGGAVMPPKGHLAVYVGEKEGSVSRVVVPVLYFNHPLFGSLLRQAEKVYGFDHPGGIQIPCPVSELERVQMKIAAAAPPRLFHHRDLFL